MQRNAMKCNAMEMQCSAMKCNAMLLHSLESCTLALLHYNAMQCNAIQCSCTPVKHKDNWRDPVTGFHINDAESENSRLKKWTRKKYYSVRGRRDAKVPAEGQIEDEMEKDTRAIKRLVAEHLFWTNKGHDMKGVMDAVLYKNGHRWKAVKLV